MSRDRHSLPPGLYDRPAARPVSRRPETGRDPRLRSAHTGRPGDEGRVVALAERTRDFRRRALHTAGHLEDMRQVLVTNDDGIEAEGLRALADALAPLGRVTVVAPAVESSAVGHGLTLRRPLELREVAPHWHSVDGTPADCVNVAVSEVLDGVPDLVVSGINDGLNIGDDVTYSGTVAGALEGVLVGAPAIAVSLQRGPRMDYAGAAYIARQLAESVLDEGLPRRTLLNVNVPRCDSPRHPGHGAGQPTPGLRDDRLPRGGTDVGPHRLGPARLGAERTIRLRGDTGRLGLGHAPSSRLDEPCRARCRRFPGRAGPG